MQILEPDDYKITFDDTDYYYTLQNYYFAKEVSYNMADSPELKELLKHVQIDYLTTEPCYQVNINGYSYIVPAKYTELAEKMKAVRLRL